MKIQTRIATDASPPANRDTTSLASAPLIPGRSERIVATQPQRRWQSPKRLTIGECTRYCWLAVLLLAPIKKGYCEAETRSNNIENFQELIDSWSMDHQLLGSGNPFDQSAIDLESWLDLDDIAESSGRVGENNGGRENSLYHFQILPTGLLYRSYLAGEKEPRMMWSALYDVKRQRTIWETALGGRVGLMRYGTFGAIKPQGFQLDLEGAVFARLIPSEPSTMLEGADFRFGLLNTWREDRLAVKWGYYHVSSHLGDEFLLANLDFERINYVRDAAIIGLIFDMNDDSQVYGEVANALGAQGGAKPWEFQFGAQYIPVKKRGLNGSPYLGANTYLRQDFDFRGGFNFIAGWNWFGDLSGERLRIGMQYYRGPSLQYSFFDRSERLIGGGIWFDY